MGDYFKNEGILDQNDRFPRVSEKTKEQVELGEGNADYLWEEVN